MNYLKNLGFILSLLIAVSSHSAFISLDMLLKNSGRNETVVRRAILDYVQKHNKVVFCFDAATNTKSFAHMQDVIMKLLKEFPDVMFVLVDVAQYQCLRESMSSFMRLYKNTNPVEDTRMLSHAKLVSLLKKHF